MDLAPLALSLRVAALSLPLVAVVGVGLGALLAARRFPGRDLVDALLTSPLVLPPTVLGYYLLVVFGRSSALGRAYESLTGSSIVFTVTGAVLAAFVGGLPLVVRAARAALESVDPTLVDAARTLGATPLRAFFTVSLPLASRGIVSGLVLAFARGLGDFGMTLMVAGNLPGETRTAALAIYDAMLAGRDDEAASLSLVLALTALSLVFVVNRLEARR